MKPIRVSIGFFLIASALISVQSVSGENAYEIKDSITVVVSNNSDNVNGDVSNIPALINFPGDDGISFREALYSANGTQGEKLILFAPNLDNDTITFSTNKDILLMSSGNLTIDGDIDNDGKWDITFDGHLGTDGTPSGNGLVIISSNNTIKNLDFLDFIYPILFATLDTSPNILSNNQIINNNIFSPRYAGIWVAQCGIGYSRSNISFKGITIEGNKIRSKAQSIYINAGVGGQDQDRVINTIIYNNQAHSDSLDALDVIVADVNSVDFEIPGPVDYSNSNIIDTMIIRDNIIEAPNGWGMHITNANRGNSNNKLQNLEIRDNLVRNVKYSAIELIAGNGGSEEKMIEDNLIKNVKITQNKIINTWCGIFISGAHIVGAGAKNNNIENVSIANNVITDYTGIGVVLIGANVEANSNYNENQNNKLDTVLIAENTLSQVSMQETGIGIEIMGGYSGGGLVQGNFINKVKIRNNKISNNDKGIVLIGGDGIGASSNSIEIEEIFNDTLENNITSIELNKNTNGATSNIITGITPTPTFTPSPGEYSSAIDVYLSCEIPSASIQFTIDGTFPTELSPLYVSPITVDTTLLIIAQAYIDNWTPSIKAVGNYLIESDTNTSVNNINRQSEQKFLFQNYPNPFHHITRVQYEIPIETRVELKIFNLVGKEICTLLDEIKPPGTYSVYWNGLDQNGIRVKDGIYLYQIITKKFKTVKKLALLSY